MEAEPDLNSINDAFRHTTIKLILEEIQNSASFDEVINIWNDNQEVLFGCRYVFSSNYDLGLACHQKVLNKTFSKGFVRAVFAHSNLFYVDSRVIKDNQGGKPSVIIADASAFLDSNAVGAIERFVNSKSDQYIAEIVDFIITKKINFNYSFYSLENRRFYEERINIPSLWAKINSVLYLDWLDHEIYAKSKKLALTIDQTELNILTDEKIDDLFRSDSITEICDYYNEFQITLHAIILKILQIQLTLPKKKIEYKMGQLLEFMHSDLRTMYIRELILGLMFFNNPNLLFFKSAKPFTCAADLKKNKFEEKKAKLNGMAWDLTLIRFLERAPTAPKVGDFLIPHLISFDLDMVDIFDKVQIKGYFSYDNQTRIIPILEKSPLKILGAVLDKACFEDYFSVEKTFARSVWQNENMLPTNRELRDKLEHDVLNLIVK